MRAYDDSDALPRLGFWRVVLVWGFFSMSTIIQYGYNCPPFPAFPLEGTRRLGGWGKR